MPTALVIALFFIMNVLYFINYFINPLSSQWKRYLSMYCNVSMWDVLFCIGKRPLTLLPGRHTVTFPRYPACRRTTPSLAVGRLSVSLPQFMRLPQVLFGLFVIGMLTIKEKCRNYELIKKPCSKRMMLVEKLDSTVGCTCTTRTKNHKL